MNNHPNVHPAASAWSEEQTLHCVAVYSNPFRWRTRRELANDFRRHIASLPNVRLYMVELAYGNRPFEVTSHENPDDLQVRTSHELFHKENLWALGVRKFPSGWQYGCCVDADFQFTRHDIALETIHLLQHHPWVQMFSSYINVSGKTEPGHGHRPVGPVSNGFAYSFVQGGCKLPDGYNGGWSEPAASGPQSGATAGALPWIGAPGGAWAFTRAGYDAVGGPIERCPLGSSDWYMAFGLAGSVLDIEIEKRLGKKANLYHPAYLDYIRAWQVRAAAEIKGNIGYVDSFAIHHFHGPMIKRGYATRDDILIKNNFNPVTDLSPDWQGVLQLTTSKPGLRDGIRRYFLSRKEDSPHPTEK